MNSIQDFLTCGPLVSVGIPTYNRPAGLRRTLECITGQTYKNLEIIVSNNCSPGLETEAVVREFMAMDTRIQYYRQEINQGATFNFQFVLEKAAAKYFMWAADDDEWEPDYIKQCVSSLESNPDAVLCYSAPFFRNYQGWKLFSHDIELTTNVFSPVIAARKILFSRYPFTVIYGLMRTSVIKNIPYKNRYGYDQTMILCLGMTGQFVKVDKGLFIYGTQGVSGSLEGMVKEQNLQKNAKYFSPLYMTYDMLEAIFNYSSKLTFAEKVSIGFLIICRNFFKKDMLLSNVFGFYFYFRDKIK